MERSRVLLVSLAVGLAGCAATRPVAHDGSDTTRQSGIRWLKAESVFVEGPQEGHGDRRSGAFLPAELLKRWLQEEALTAGEIELVSRGARRGPAAGARRPPLLNARPPIDPGRYWRQQPPDPQLLEQARQLYRQRLTEVQQRYPNSQGYQYHHAIPIYMGGTAKGPTYRLPTAYHQAITQEFRREWPYGQEPPPTQQLAEIMLRVYSKYPIPQLIGLEP